MQFAERDGSHSSFLKFSTAVLLVLLLAAVCCVGAASAVPEGPVTINNVYLSTGGLEITQDTVTNAYKIACEDDWEYVTEHSEMWSNVLVLTSDIVFTEPVKSVGSSSQSTFKGTIYGNGFKFINFTQSGTDARGLIYLAGDGCVLNYVQMIDSKIDSSSTDVGGLIGASSSANENGVKVLKSSVVSSSIMSSKGFVGGLVGNGFGDSKLWINASLVDSVYIKADTSTCGGMIAGGTYNSVVITDSRVSRCEIYANVTSGGGVGGTMMNGDTASATIKNTTVENCKIGNSGTLYGGLVGYIYKGNIHVDGCTVKNSTVISSKENVGGLVGGVDKYLTFEGDSTSVEWTWIGGIHGGWNGYGGIGSIIGFSDPNLPEFITGISPSYTMTYGISDVELSPVTYAFDNKFNGYKSLDDAAAEGVGSVIDREHLVVGIDYGYALYPVTVISDSHGTASVSGYGKAKLPVQLTATPDAGYHLDSWRSGDVTVEDDNTFTMPAKAVTVTAHFTANENTVNYYTLPTERYGSFSYTFNETVELPSEPTREGYTFNSWNISSASGYLFSDNTTYFNADKWNYTGANGETLNVYANWTANTYSVNFHPNNGTDEAVKTQEFTYDAGEQPLALNTFTNGTDYIFGTWNTEKDGSGKVYSNGKNVSNLNATKGGVFDLYAQWAKNESAAGGNVTFTETKTPVKKVDVSHSGITSMAAFLENASENLPETTAGCYVTQIGQQFNLTITGGIVGAANYTVVSFNVTADTSITPATIRLAHFNGNIWDKFIVPTYLNQVEGYHMFSAKVDSFSIFSVVSMVEIPQPQQSSSSSRSYGASVWLPATAEPTPTAEVTPEPTQAVPTVSPIQTQQPASTPAPFIGLLSGLGAAAVFFGLRRK